MIQDYHPLAEAATCTTTKFVIDPLYHPFTGVANSHGTLLAFTGVANSHGTLLAFTGVANSYGTLLAFTGVANSHGTLLAFTGVTNSHGTLLAFTGVANSHGTLLAFAGVANSHEPSPQPSAFRSYDRNGSQGWMVEQSGPNISWSVASPSLLNG